MKHLIHPSLVPLAVDITSLNADPRNARLHSDRNLREVMESYRVHGQRKAIVVQMTADNGMRNVVRAGNGQVAAAKKLGWTHIAAVIVDENDREAIKFALRDNRTAELAEWDYEVLAREEATFQASGESLTSIGWEEQEVVPLRETTWFADTKGSLDDHSRTFQNDDDKSSTDKSKASILVKGVDAEDLEKAAELMRTIAPEGAKHMGRVIGRLARHFLATVTHSRASKANENEPDAESVYGKGSN